MKKLILFSFAILSWCSAFSQIQPKQNAVYVRAGIGYSLAFGGSYAYANGLPVSGEAREIYTNSVNAYSYDINKASYGSGLTAAAGFGYMFTPNVGIDLGVTVGLVMKKHEYRETSFYSSITRTSYAKLPIIVMPSLVLATGGNRTNLYTRLGLAVAVSSKIVADDYGSSFPRSFTMTTVTRNRLSVGFTGTVGAKFNISNNVAISAELNAMYLQLNASTSEITAYEIDREDYLQRLTSSERITEYSETFILESYNTHSLQKSTHQPVTGSFNNAGFAIGVCLEL